ncbi:MAG: arylsulfatase, partial [Bryobacterales bacterium]|nr:arylsulfatase [Bryobacterales bacterium]
MSRPSVLLTAILGLAAIPSLGRAAAQPNIILMMADDMGMGDTSAYQDFTGNADEVQLYTPHMERLAHMGVRFTDAHTPSSRCSPTRYSLLTGRYAWRSRLKHWVLFGAQGDPMIEPDRPTIASMLRDHGYATAMYGKWHVGLRYRRADGSPAAGWEDADLTKPLHTSPLDHGFDHARFTSRSHGTSGPNAPEESSGRGPGHVHGRTVVAATGDGKRIAVTGSDAYLLHRLGGRHSDNAMQFLSSHVSEATTKSRPFFLYYPANANHGPYTPDETIGGVAVAGAARTKSGQPMDARHDYIFENDVALGRMLDWLEKTTDPRQPDSQLIETTLVIFTSDNGAEKNSDIATGPFRSNKGSAYEGGHRVPFIVSWPQGGVGAGDSSNSGASSPAPISLTDIYATFAEIIGAELPDARAGEKGGEDSFSVLSALRGNTLKDRPPLIFNDHKEAKSDPAAVAIRIDSPRVGETVVPGQWKLFLDASLLRAGEAKPYELFNLAEDPQERSNLISTPGLKPLIDHMTALALLHRNAGGHRLAEIASRRRETIDWTHGEPPRIEGLELSVSAVGGELAFSNNGLGISGGQSDAVDGGEAILISFNTDVLVESAAIVVGEGAVGGSYRVGSRAPLAIYCVDGDIDHRDQSGILSDIGLLKKGEELRFDSGPHYGNESSGEWRLKNLTVRLLQ